MTAEQAKRIAVLLRDSAQSLPHFTSSHQGLRAECYALAEVIDREVEQIPVSLESWWTG